MVRQDGNIVPEGMALMRRLYANPRSGWMWWYARWNWKPLVWRRCWFESLDGWLPSRGVVDTTLRAGARIHFRFKRAHAPQVGNVFSRHFLRLLCPSHVSARSKKQWKIPRADAGAVKFDLWVRGRRKRTDNGKSNIRFCHVWNRLSSWAGLL